ncbi:MAG: hypothetical protein ACYC54_11490 [Sedimentisphaerales bacterium]
MSTEWSVLLTSWFLSWQGGKVYGFGGDSSIFAAAASFGQALGCHKTVMFECNT